MMSAPAVWPERPPAGLALRRDLLAHDRAAMIFSMAA